MTTTRACRNCGQPSPGPYCAAHAVIVPTASRRQPEPGALAPSADAYYRLNADDAFTFGLEILRRRDAYMRDYRVSMEVIAGMAIQDAMREFLPPFAELPPPLRRTPSGGVATLDGVITQVAQQQREPYAPAGMTACCVVCTPVSWWLSAASRDAHAAEKHPTPDHPPP